MVFSHKRAVVEILVFSKIVRSRLRKWSKIEVEKMVLFVQVEKIGSPDTNTTNSSWTLNLKFAKDEQFMPQSVLFESISTERLLTTT